METIELSFKTRFYSMTESDWEEHNITEYEEQFDGFEDCDDAEVDAVGQLLVDPDDTDFKTCIVDHLGNIRLKVWMKRKWVMMQRPYGKPFKHMHYNDAF